MSILLTEEGDSLLAEDGFSLLLDLVAPGPTTYLPGTVGSFVYPKARDAFLQGLIDVTPGQFAAQAVDGRVTYDPSHEFVIDIDSAGLLGSLTPFPPDDVYVVPVRVPPASFLRFFSTIGEIRTPDTDDTPNAQALLIVYGDGTPATTRLVAYLGQRTDSRRINTSTRRGGIIWTFPQYVFSI